MANKNNSNQKTVKNYIDLLYMTPEVVTAKDIAALFRDTVSITIQLWEEMNVLELELSDDNSIDFEVLDPNFKDPSDAAFVKNRNIKTIFAIKICDADLAAVTPYFDQLVAKHSGFVCADSDDFTPVYSGTSKR